MTQYKYVVNVNDLEKALPSKPSEEKPLPTGASRTPPKGYPERKSQYASPNEWKYPLDTEKHVRAAMSYFSKPENHNIYNPGQRVSIAKRICAAAKKYNIDDSGFRKKFNLDNPNIDAEKACKPFKGEGMGQGQGQKYRED